MTIANAVALLDAYGPSISRRLNTLHDDAHAEYREDGIGNPTVSVYAFDAWILALQDIDDRGMVPVGELRDGDATAVLMIGVNDGEMEVVYR